MVDDEGPQLVEPDGGGAVAGADVEDDGLALAGGGEGGSEG